MLTPFFGLSVFIHVCIIGIGMLLALAPLKRKKRKQEIPKRYIVTNILAVAVSASSFVYVSLNDGRSSYKLITNYISSKTAALPVVILSIDLGDEGVYLPVAEATTTNYVSLIDCLMEVERLSKEYGGSVVNYLNAQGEDYTFEFRKILADEYGVEDYRGTEEQNITLLENMLLNEVVASSDREACKIESDVVNSPDINSD
jgi:hypothetical protein